VGFLCLPRDPRSGDRTGAYCASEDASSFSKTAWSVKYAVAAPAPTSRPQPTNEDRCEDAQRFQRR
jgi:hypothetical protein